MRHEEFHILEELSAKNVKMGVVSLNTNKNGVCENETFAVAFYGEIFGILDFEQETIKFPIQVPEQILELVQQNGEEIIQNFNGTFLIAVFDKRKNELIIYNDRFGTHPLYYCLFDNETFVFASEAKALFNGRTPDPDYVGLAELLSFDYCLESRTIFKGIEIVLPAIKIKVTSDKITMERYWCFSGKSLRKKQSRKKYEEEFYTIFKAAVTCRQTEKNIIGLTGGYDSRFILALLGDKSIESFNFGNRGSGDVIGAQILADSYHTNHHYVSFTEEDFYPYARDIVYRTDGKCCFDRFYVYQTAKEKRKFSGIEISGTGGDAFSGQKSNFTGLLPMMGKRIDSKQRKKESKKLFKNITRGRLSVGESSCYNPLFQSRIWDEVQKDFDKAVSACNGKTFGSFTMQLKARTLEKNSTLSTLLLCEQFITMRYPVYDYRVMDFFDTVPQKYRYGQNLYVSTIRDFFPKAAMAPHSETGKPIGRYNSLNVDWVTMKSFIKNKLGFRKNPYNNSFGFVKEIILSDEKRLQKLIYKQPKSEEGIFILGKYKTVECLIAEAQQGDEYAYTLLKNVITVSLLNELFFDGKIPMYYNETIHS